MYNCGEMIWREDSARTQEYDRPALLVSANWAPWRTCACVRQKVLENGSTTPSATSGPAQEASIAATTALLNDRYDGRGSGEDCSQSTRLECKVCTGSSLAANIVAAGLCPGHERLRTATA